MTTLIGILILGVLILFHEAGHFLLARLVGIRVIRFSIGFGPRLLGYKLGETEYQLAAIPFGGFVQVAGMHSSENLPTDDPGSYANKGVLKQAAFVAAGPLANLLLAWLVFASAFMGGIAQQDLSRPAIGQVIPDRPAARVGLEPGDLIVKIDDQTVSTFEDLQKAINRKPGQEIQLLVKRQDREITFRVTPDDRDGVGLIGITPPLGPEVHLGFLKATEAAVSICWEKAAEMLKGVYRLVAGTSPGRLVGVPGIVGMISESAEQGITALLATSGTLSIAVMIFNLLPIPALDGGRLIFLLLGAIRRRPINERIEQSFHVIGLLLLLGLMLFVSIRDLVIN